MSQEYSIPRCLWESLDAVLYSKGLSLAKELAKELGVSAQPLIAQLNTIERSKFTIIPDDEATTYQCKAPLHGSAVIQRCRQPVLGPSGFCSAHERSSAVVPANLPLVQRVITSETTYMTHGTAVYTLNGEACGELKGTKLKLFVIDA
jgi:hypothetical protein